MDLIQEQTCWECGQSKPLSEFSRNATKKLGVENHCKICRRAYMSKWSKQAYTTAKGRKANLRYNYGITPTEYRALFEAQQGKCAICGRPETSIDDRTKQVKYLHVDHCHTTGKVRSLLCAECNAALGQMHDDPERIRLLLAYAEAHLN